MEQPGSSQGAAMEQQGSSQGAGGAAREQQGSSQEAGSEQSGAACPPPPCLLPPPLVNSWIWGFGEIPEFTGFVNPGTPLVDSGISPNRRIHGGFVNSGIWGFGEIPVSTGLVDPGIRELNSGIWAQSPNPRVHWTSGFVDSGTELGEIPESLNPRVHESNWIWGLGDSANGFVDS